MSNIVKKTPENNSSFDDYDLIIFENVKIKGKAKENQDLISDRYKSILSFSDTEIEINKFPCLKEFQKQNKAHYCERSNIGSGRLA